jgi:hypothetical protein
MQLYPYPPPHLTLSVNTHTDHKQCRIPLFLPNTLVGISESCCMHSIPNAQSISESYLHRSIIITIISLSVFVYHFNGTSTQYLRNHNVQEMYSRLAHLAVRLLLFIIYHRSLHIDKFGNHNMCGMCGILVHPAVPLLLFVMYHRLLVKYPYI